MLDSAKYEDPLDLLRRFIPTPFRTRFRVAATTVVVATNDFSLLPALPLETGFGEFVPSSVDWKLVRDSDASGALQQPLLMASGQITMVVMGAACLLGVDHERHELLCFIGPDVDTRTFQDVLVPFLCRLSMEPVAALSGKSVDGRNGDVPDA